MQRIKVTVQIEEEYEYEYSDKKDIRTRDVELYKQTIVRSGEPDSNVDGLIKEISQVVNK